MPTGRHRTAGLPGDWPSLQLMPESAMSFDAAVVDHGNGLSVLAKAVPQ
jgi:hypothetical protein